MLRFFYNFLRNIKSKIRQFFFLHKYRKDTPESTWKFYNQMKYFASNNCVQNIIAIYYFSFFIYNNNSVTIPIHRDTILRFVIYN